MCVRGYDSSKKAERRVKTTVTGQSYEDVLRTKFLPALREKRPKKAAAVLFHHDNAPPHQAARVHQLFDDNNFEVVPHAPYSLDLAPSDFWLFPTLKDTLRGRTFSSLATAIFQWSDEPLKKRLLRPCNRGVSVVKNVYVYRVITLRNDCIFSFLWWVDLFKQIRRP